MSDMEEKFAIPTLKILHFLLNPKVVHATNLPAQITIEKFTRQS